MQYTLDAGELGEISLDVDYDYTPYQRGRISGPPEDCYPDEPAEICATAATLENGTKLPPWLEGVVLEALNESGSFWEAVIEYEEGRVEDAKCDAGLSRRDAYDEAA